LCDQGRGYDEIIFANDSVYGPFTDIAPILQRFSGTSTPFLGLTLTKEYAPHVQSFFLGFNMRVFPRRLFEAFWNSVEPLNDKNEIIDRYEIGLSRTIAAAGIPLSAVFDMREQRIRIGILKLFSQLSPERWTDVLAVRRIWGAQFTRRSNPMMAHWREVLDAGVPYVKVELMRDNPVGVSRSAVLKAVAAYGGPHAANIRAHLSAIGAIGNHRQ
jgi:rhamnosyltransferase